MYSYVFLRGDLFDGDHSRSLRIRPVSVLPPAGDIYYDEIEAGLEISRLQREKEVLFLQIKAFYLAFFGGQA